jgi:transglutaminase-like putative cysteine protease
MPSHPNLPEAPDDPGFEMYLQPGYYADSDHPNIREFAHSCCDQLDDPAEKAKALYYRIRDGWQYNPYDVRLDEEYNKASNFLDRSQGYCIEKANLMSAAARAVGIPTRLGFADVVNHIGTEKLEAYLGTNRLVFHGYIDLFIHGKWVKATPAFNKSLCEKLGVPALDFDAENDSIFQAFSADGTEFMEYIEDRGVFVDWPMDEFAAALKQHYGHLFKAR